MLESFHLQNDPAVYIYTREGAATVVSSSPLHLNLHFNKISYLKNSCSYILKQTAQHKHFK